MKKSMKKLLVMSMVGAMLMGSAPAVIANAEEATTETTTEVTTEQTDTTEASKTGTDKKKPAKPQKVSVSKATCTSAGKVNISFRKNVSYASDLAVKIIAADGTEKDATITKKTKGMLVISGAGLVKGEKYTVEITGIKVKGSEVYTSTKCSFTAKKIKTTCEAKKIKNKVAAKSKNRITVKCNKSVVLADTVTVTVTDADGNTYDAKIAGKSKGNIKVSVSKLEKGKKYTVVINGVKGKKEANFGSISTTFVTKK